jgi:hypothetical protein
MLGDARSALIKNFHFDDSGSANIMIFNHRKIEYWVLDDDDRRRASFERHCAVDQRSPNAIIGFNIFSYLGLCDASGSLRSCKWHNRSEIALKYGGWT